MLSYNYTSLENQGLVAGPSFMYYKNLFLDPLVSGSELATYGSNLLDFSQLFDDTSDQIEGNDVVPIDIAAVESAPMETPQIETEEPIFPLPE